MPPKLRPVKKQISLTSNPPQHVYENDPSHRSFLSRSLSKSDTELHAIMKLNSSLNQLKNYIIDEFGMDVLLDIGEGKITIRRKIASGNNTEEAGGNGDDGEDGDKKGEKGNESGSAEKETGSEEVVFVNVDKEAVRVEFEVENDNGQRQEDGDDIANENSEVQETTDGIKKEDSDGKEDGEAENDKESSVRIKTEDTTGEKETNKDENLDEKANPTKDEDVDMKAEETNETSALPNSTKPNPTNISNILTTNPSYQKFIHLSTSSPTFLPSIKSFLLRLRLRRKLLNRLSRRLLRLSYSMDGKLHKINPPMLPKYGTSYTYPNDKGVKDKVNEWNKDFECREEVKGKVWKKKEAWGRKKEEEEKRVAKEEQVKNDGDSDVKMEDGNQVKQDNDQMKDDTTEMKKDDGAVAVKKETDGEDVEMKDESSKDTKDKEDNNTSVISHPPETETTIADDKGSKQEKDAKQGGEEKATSNLDTSFDFDPFLLDTEHQKNLEKLIEYDMDYAKKHTIHVPTSTILRCTTALTKEELAALDKDEDDFDDTANNSGGNADGSGKKRMSHGIGAVSKFMTKKEKVMEWKRWQTEFLSKIPDQPTFNDLSHGVFMLEQRRKLCNSKESGDNTKNEEEKEEKDNNLKRKEEKISVDDGSEKDDDDSISNAKKKASEIEASIMKQKRICLDPVPSFHQQDYSRILMIQSATLSAALNSNSRDTYLQAKNEYESIFKRSHAIQQQKNDAEKELHKIMYDLRLKINSINQSNAMAKVKWEKDKKSFDDAQRIHRMQMKTQLTRTMPSPAVMEAMSMTDDDLVKRSLAATVDRVTIRTAPKEHSSGTPYISSALRRCAPNSSVEQVGTTLAHCVDVVAKRYESGWLTDAVINEARDGDQFRPFVPPSSTSPDVIIMNTRGETYTQLEKRLKADIAKLQTQLDASEAARSKAWSRLNKAKAAYNSRSSGGGSGAPSAQAARSYRPKASTTARYGNSSVTQGYNQMQSRSNTSYQTPTSMAKNPAVASAAAAAAAVKANMNMGTGMVANTPSENKYSIDKVRARMYSDGSVLPVSEPKRGKDGLFLRPAGRQRKGMDWDALNGKWVPQGTLNR